MTLLQNLRLALRGLWRAPGFTLVAVLTIGLGIGAIGAVLSLANALLWRPLPVRDADRLVLVTAQRTSTGEYEDFSWADYLDFRRAGEFDGVVAYYPAAVSLGLSGAGERIYGEMVSGNYFDVLGIPAALGRVFTAAEGEDPGAAPAIVISDGFWRARLGADPGVVGRTVRLNGQRFTVLGVAPATFHGIYYLGFQAEFWAPAVHYRLVVPNGAAALTDRGQASFRMMGRLAPGVSARAASQSVAAIAARLAESYPASNAGLTAEAIPERDTRPEPGATAAGNRLLFRILLAVGLLVVLVAAANVASLLLARAVSRRREIAVRLALGASRLRLLTQLLGESLVLALLGGIVGLGFADLARHALTGLLRFPTDIPFVLEFPLDARVLGLTALATLAAAVVFGLAPALQASRPVLTDALKDGGGGGTSGGRARLRRALVLAQVAVCCLLLVGTGLGLRTLQALRQVSPGFRTDHALLVTVNPGLVGYDAARGQRFYQSLLERTRALPGAAAVTIAGNLPLEFSSRGGPLFAEGLERAPGAGSDAGDWSTVAPGYFAASGTPLRTGRDFSVEDDSAAPRVAVVSEALARSYWPGGSAVGHRLRLGAAGATPVEIVGVVADVKVRQLTEPPHLMVYLPLAQDYVPAMTLLVRTRGEPLALAGAVREVVRSLDPDVPVADVKSFEMLLEGRALLFARFAAILSAALGGLALVLAVIGLYGLVSFGVSQRQKELGIRVALGADAGAIIGLVVRGGMRLALTGSLIGLGLALGSTRLARGLLYGVSPTDPLVLAGIPALLLVVTLAACWIPARRAARNDPVAALRGE